MIDNYEELSRLATKGDKDALKELFAFAEGLAAEQQFEEATVAFCDAAIAYRISAFRNKTRAEDAESRAARLVKVQGIYQRWIEQNPEGFRELPYSSEGFDSQCIRRVVFEELLREEPFVEICVFLQHALHSLGVRFSSPGGSIYHHIWWLVGKAFDLQTSGDASYLRNMDIRIGVDLLADEIAKRCQSAQQSDSVT